MLRPVAAVLSVFVMIATLGVASVAVAPAASARQPVEGGTPNVLINELANGDARSDSNSFVELRNWGDAPADLTGWHVFRCSAQGLRSNVGRPEGDLTGIVLAAGATLTISKVGMPGQLHMTSPYDLTGFGLYLEDPEGRAVDLVGVYPNEPWPTESECSPASGNLPGILDFSRGESWQRVAATGDVQADFVVAPSTPGTDNATGPEPVDDRGIVISELAGAGPTGADDDFVELQNRGDAAVDIGGWTLYRCTASGRLRSDTRELTVPGGTVLEPGERWLIGGPGYSGRREPDARYGTALADVEFGVLVRTADGRLADRAAVTAYRDSACQGDVKLPAVLDAVAAESWQRTADGWVAAERTPGLRNAVRDRNVMGQSFAYPADRPSVAISEIATDPTTDGMPAGSVQRSWIELGNYGAESVDIGGWTLRRCQADGTRAQNLQVTIPPGTTLAAGDVYLAARAGTEAAADADATYDTALNFLGTGVWVADASGRRVDSVGVYAANEMDSSNVTPSPCTKGVALTTYQPDRMLQQTFQRSRFTGVDADDFVVRAATPGAIDEVAWVDPTVRVSGVEGPGTAGGGSGGLDTPPAAALDPLGTPVRVLEAWGGLAGGTERPLGGAAVPVTDDGYGMPFQRLVLDASSLRAGSEVQWAGTTSPRQGLRLSVWSAGAWRELATGAGDSSGRVVLQGALVGADLRDRTATIMVETIERAATTTSAADGLLEDPATYDLAITHITDTQYLSESYPEVYAQLVSWIADNAADRKIAFASHTGDLVQNWVDPDQSLDRATREFERASAIQGILDDAGVPNSVLPGNHDSKRGVTEDLFNQYFPPSRYADEPWYGGSLAPDDNSANFSTFEQAGARFLMLSLPYAYSEAELVWAEGVVAAHPDYNVIVSTHEHVTPKTDEVGAGRSTGSRWVSRGAELWERVIAPHRNVVLVLSGHFHGLGQLTTENAGGIEGHTVVELLADYQEFRTHTGERATGFQRLLQLDLASGTVAVDTFSTRLGASASYPYDYRQFLPDNGLTTTPANGRPWRIVEEGLQDRYTTADDEFAVRVVFQYDKTVATTGVTARP